MTLSSRERRFKEVYDTVERRIETRYGVPVRISDVLDPNTGDFDGVEIALDHDQNLDMAVFVLLHLFGHTVQWNTSTRYRELGLSRVAIPAPPLLLRRIHAYERRASAFGLSLLHDCGIRDLDGWLSDWADADWRFLEAYYKTGRKLPFDDLLRAGRPKLRPIEIPKFTPTHWGSRYAF